jgi:hypothetical protein
MLGSAQEAAMDTALAEVQRAAIASTRYDDEASGNAG